MTKNEEAIKFAEEHADMDDDKFWALAKKKGFTEEDFING